jgi:hypothetical protein
VLTGAAFPLEGMVLALTTEFGEPDSERLTIRFGAIDATTRIAIASALIFGRKRLAERFAGTSTLPHLVKQDLLAILLAAVGATLCLRGAAGAAQQLATGGDWRVATGGGVLLLFGTALFLGASGVARVWNALRSVR